MWIKQKSCSDSRKLAIFSCPSSISFYFKKLKYYAEVPKITSQASISPETTAQCNNWTFLAIVYNQSNLFITLNGAEFVETSASLSSSSISISSSSETCFIGNNQEQYGVSAYIRNLFVLSYAAENHCLDLMNKKIEYSSQVLMFLTFDSPLQDEYNAKFDYSSSSNFEIQKSNEAEFACYCSNTGILGIKFASSADSLSNSVGVAQKEQFTFETWIYPTSFTLESDTPLITHKYFWQIMIDSSQNVILLFYSSPSAAYKQYPTYSKLALNRWTYVAVVFDYNKASTILSPAFSRFNYQIDTTIHPVVDGSLSAFMIGGSAGFTGYISSVKYFSKYLESLPSSDDTSVTYLLYYYKLIRESYNSYVDQYGIITNSGHNSQEYLILNRNSDFEDEPSLCNSSISYSENQCVDNNYYLNFGTGNSGLVSWTTIYATDLTFEMWLFSKSETQECTLLEFQNTDSESLFKASLTSSALSCFPSIRSLGSNSAVKITQNISQSWAHFACAIDGSVTNAAAYLYLQATSYTASATFSPLVSPEAGLFNVFFGKNYKGYIKELRMWQTSRTAAQIEAFRFQMIDTKEESSLFVYFPFSSESERTIFQSAITEEDPPFAKLKSTDDYKLIGFKYCDTSLILCPVGQIHINNKCLVPYFYLNFTDLTTDYLIKLESNIPFSYSFFSYHWGYFSLSPSSVKIQSYLDQKINSIQNNEIDIFKPALDGTYNVKLEVDITSSLYSTHFNSIKVFAEKVISNNIKCPTASLNTSFIELSNLNYSPRVGVLLSASSCVVQYNVESILWSVKNQLAVSQFYKINSENLYEISITPELYNMYSLNSLYTIQVELNVSMNSSSNEIFYQTINTSVSVLRHEYQLSYSVTGSFQVNSWDTLNISGAFDIVKDNSQLKNLEKNITYVYSCPSGFSASYCEKLDRGIKLTPLERMNLNIAPGTYHISATGYWETLEQTQGVIIQILEPDPRISLVDSSFFSSFIKLILNPVDSTICNMKEMEFSWYLSSNYSEVLSESHELLLSKNNDYQTRRVIAKMHCKQTDKLFYDFYTLTFDKLGVLSVSDSSQYSVTPLKDAFVVEIQTSINATNMLFIRDLLSTQWIAAESLAGNEEIELYLPYTDKIKIMQSGPLSESVEKILTVSTINIYSTQVSPYLELYLGRKDKLKELLYVIIHVHNTGNSFSTLQRTQLMSNLISVLSQLSEKTSIHLDLLISGVDHLRSELNNNIDNIIEFLNLMLEIIKYRNYFEIRDWELAISNIIKIISKLFISQSGIILLYPSKKLIITQKLYNVIAGLEEWGLSALSAYHTFSYKSDAFSLHLYKFSNNIPSERINSTISFEDDIHNIKFSVPLLFAQNGFEATTNSSSINSDEEDLRNHGISVAIFKTEYLMSSNLTTISGSAVNISLFHMKSNSSNSIERVKQKYKINNKYFDPKITFTKISSPLNISESECSCPSDEATCRTRVLFNTSNILCEFDSTGLIYPFVYYNPIGEESEEQINFLFISIYWIGLLVIFSGLGVMAYCKDKKDCQQFLVSEEEIRKHYIITNKQSSTFKILIKLLMLLSHPLISIFYRYRINLDRITRLIILSLFCTILCLLFWLCRSLFGNSTPDIVKICLIFSICTFPFFLFCAHCCFLILEKYIKKGNQIEMKPQEGERNLSDREAEIPVEMQSLNDVQVDIVQSQREPEESKSVSQKESSNSENIEEEENQSENLSKRQAFQMPEELAQQINFLKAEENLRKDNEEGSIRYINQDIKPASHLSGVIDCESLKITDRISEELCERYKNSNEIQPDNSQKETPSDQSGVQNNDESCICFQPPEIHCDGNENDKSKSSLTPASDREAIKALQDIELLIESRLEESSSMEKEEQYRIDIENNSETRILHVSHTEGDNVPLNRIPQIYNYFTQLRNETEQGQQNEIQEELTQNNNRIVERQSMPYFSRLKIIFWSINLVIILSIDCYLIVSMTYSEESLCVKWMICSIIIWILELGIWSTIFTLHKF